MNISKTELRILDYLAKKHGKGAYGRKISKEIGISTGAASQGLRNLEKADIITKLIQGRETYYYADPESHLIKHFKVFMNILKISPLIKNLKKVSKRVILYGSCAKGTDTEESDIDLFILTENKEKVKEFINKFRFRTRKISPLIKTSTEFISIKVKDKTLYSSINKGLVLWDIKNEL